MADEVVIRSGQRTPIGERWVEIRDDGCPVHFTDFILEGRHHMGVVYLAFGNVVWDAGTDQIVQVASRIRMNLGTAQDLHKLLGDMITDALKPADKSKAN